MNDTTIPVLTIDGPSASGKGEISRRVARALGWHLLDSGALYRLVALAAQRHAIALDAEGALGALAGHLDVQFLDAGADAETRILLEGEEVTTLIRAEAVGEAASRAAALPAVREGLLARQRAFRQPPGLVADGRDMGSVVFPTAGIKVFLTASAEERARRRYKQLKEKGMDANLDSLVEDIGRRDQRDVSRPVAPLRPAPDAVLLDSTALDIEAVTSRVLALVRGRAA